MVKVLAVLFLFQSTMLFAANEPQRFLPKGEENVAIITSIYSSPEGEVEILETNFKESSALLRLSTGKLCSFKSIDGPAACEDWFLSQNKGIMPRGCILSFENEDNTCFKRIQTDELKEASLFRAVKSLVRSSSVAL